MPNRVFAAQVVRAFSATPIPDAELYVYENGTLTQRDVYAADGETVLNQPLVSYSDGTFDAFYILDNEPVRILIRDEDGNPLPGYPLDDVYPNSAAGSTAAGVAFEPTEGNPSTNVQDALVAVEALATGQDDLLGRTMTFWTTGGSGNAFTIAPSPPITAYEIGRAFWILPNRANTGSATLNVNGVGARQLRKFNRSGVAVQLVTGDIQPGRPELVIDDGAQFIRATVHEEGGNTSDGFYARLSGGLQICFHTVTLSFSDSNTIGGTWTFPAPFLSAPRVMISLPPGGSWTGITPGEVVPPRFDASTTSVNIAVDSVTGSAGFVSGDSIASVGVCAIGRAF